MPAGDVGDSDALEEYTIPDKQSSGTVCSDVAGPATAASSASSRTSGGSARTTDVDTP